MTMRTTLRFTSIVAGVAALVVLAAIILSANDWLSTPPGVNARIAVRASAPAPQLKVPSWRVVAPTPQPTPTPTEPVATSEPALAPAAPVPAPQPVAAAVHVAVAPPAVRMAPENHQHGDQPAGHRHDSGGGHDGGGGGHGGGDNQDR
jgi:hypothetical protein